MELLLKDYIHRQIIVELLPRSRKFLWIVTSDIKDLHGPKGRRFVPLLEILSDLVESGVAVRLMHAKEPDPRFREDFERYPNLIKNHLFARDPCQRIHTKAIVIEASSPSSARSLVACSAAAHNDVPSRPARFGFA